MHFVASQPWMYKWVNVWEKSGKKCDWFNKHSVKEWTEEKGLHYCSVLLEGFGQQIEQMTKWTRKWMSEWISKQIDKDMSLQTEKAYIIQQHSAGDRFLAPLGFAVSSLCWYVVVVLFSFACHISGLKVISLLQLSVMFAIEFVAVKDAFRD